MRNSIGLRSNKENKEVESNMHYGVHFTIAGFETNKGQAWKRLCYGIQTFMKYLGDEDVVGAVTYTNKVHQFWGEEFFTTRESISM